MCIIPDFLGNIIYTFALEPSVPYDVLARDESGMFHRAVHLLSQALNYGLLPLSMR